MRTLPLLAFFILTVCSSCVSYNELVNFQEMELERGRQEQIENDLELQIQPRDLLRIEVESFDPAASAPFNGEGVAGGIGGMGGAGGGATGGGGGGMVGQMSNQNLQLFQGYLVDQAGYVDLPLLGRVQAAGQTIESLAFLVRGKLETYIKDPVVNIRYLNFKVTVLGEVMAPGVVSLPNSRVTILEALGMVGDLTDYANRKSVLVIREEGGERSYKRLNLQSDKIFTSEYYYLKQNDVVYVEPIRARVATVSDPGQRFLSYFTTALGTLLSAATLIVALNNN